MSRKSTILLILIGVVVLLAVAAMSIDYGTGLVRDKVAEAVRDNLDSQMARGAVSGNPFKGYRLSDIAIVTDGEEVLTAELVTAKVSVISLLTGGPPVSMLEISGFHSGVDKINRLIPRIKPGEGGGELPIKKLRIVDSTFQSEWAKVNIRDVRLAFAGEEIQTDLDLVADELPVKGELDLTRAGDAWSIVRMDVDIGQGNLTAKGELAPKLSVKGSLEELEVSSVVAFWPEADQSLYKGDFSTEFAAEGTWLDPDISGNIDFTGEMLAGIPVEQATARWRFRSKRLDVAGLDMRLFGFPLAGNLAFVFDPGTPPRMLVKLQGSAADLETLAKVSEKLEGVSGTLDKFTVDLQGPVASPEGRVDFKAGKLGYKGYTVSDTVLDVRIKGGNVTISGKSVFKGAPVTVGGNVSNFMTDPAVNVSGTLRSLSLEVARDLVPALKEMKASGRINADYKVSGKLPDFVISGKAWSDKLSVMDYVFSKVASFFDYNVKADTLRFSDLKAGWKQATITGNGKISKLSSENRSGDIAIRAGNLDSAFFAGFYPPVAEYDLKGTMAVEVEIKGALSNPAIDVSLTSPSLSVKDGYRFTNLKAGTSLASVPAGIPSDIRLDMSADTATVAGMVLRNVKVGLRKKDQVVTISEGKAVFGGGNVATTGTVTLAEPAEKTTLDFVVNASKVNLGKVLIGGGKGLPASGVITAEAHVSGTVENPQIAVNASAPFVAASGVKVDGVKVKLAGDMNKLSIEEMSGKVGEGSIAVTGDVKPAPFAADVSVNGQNLDLKPMTSRFEKLKPYDITGAVDLVFEGHFEENKHIGTGKVTSASVRFMGINFTDISLPFELLDDRLVSSSGTAMLYGGKVSNKGTLNLTTMGFTDEAEVTGTDVNALLKDAFKLQGNITGSTDAFAKVSGAFGKNGLNYSGKGLLKMGRGSVTGFKLVDIATAVYGTKGINYASVHAPFNLETGRIILKSDTLVKAPDGDPLYRYFSAAGPVGPGNSLNLDCSGKVNVKVINAVLGGATGGAAGLTGTQNIIGILEGVIKGMETGMREDDFRDVSFTLKGTFDKPGISNVKVAVPEKQEQITPSAEEETEVKDKALETTEETAEQKKENIEEKIKEEIFKKIFD
ncbi:MAG: AsmA-like C-terminal region-containing protein [Thermovirgaceae bacterium]